MDMTYAETCSQSLRRACTRRRHATTEVVVPGPDLLQLKAAQRRQCVELLLEHLIVCQRVVYLLTPETSHAYARAHRES